MYRRYSNDMFLISGYIYFSSNSATKMFAQAGAQILPFAQPLILKKCLQLKTKLFSLSSNAKKVVTTLVATVLLDFLFKVFFAAAIPPELE